MLESNSNCLNQRIYVQILLDHTTTVTIMSISCLRKDRLRQIGRWLKAIKQLQKIVVEK